MLRARAGCTARQQACRSVINSRQGSWNPWHPGRSQRLPHLQQLSAYRDWWAFPFRNTSPDAASQKQGQTPQAQEPLHRTPARRDYLEARQVSLYQLFDGREFTFDIPAYQRPYSWSIKQISELLHDFLASFKAKSEYFLGSIVTVRTEDGPHTSLQVIDGQQRLTSLVILLAYIHSVAKTSGNTALQQRVQRMLYIEPEPLDPSSKGRFRLQLRVGDESFFTGNMFVDFLPLPYHLAGVAADPSSWSGYQSYARDATQNYAVASNYTTATAFYQGPVTATQPAAQQQASSSSNNGNGNGAVANASRPLENESWWRMYETAGHMQAVLSAEMAAGLPLSDFLFHVLRNCHVVLMNARDEKASFRIFSTLNSRGMDLSMVDKLKADLLEVLEPYQRAQYNKAWSEMENILGRSAFHRVFDYMRVLALIVNPGVEHMSVLEYFSQHRHDPAAVIATTNCALNYGRMLLQLRQCRFEVAPPSVHEAATGTTPLLSEDGSGGFVMALDDGGPNSAVHTYGDIRLLERQARHMRLFADDVWLPATLEFFQQIEDMEVRSRFLQAAEALQLYLELCCDAAHAQARWHGVAEVVIQPHHEDVDSIDAHMQAVFAALALTAEEKKAFRLKLGKRDLATSAPQRTLAHLLLRAEGAAVSSSPTLDFSSLHVERILPTNPPEGSQWRRSKISISSKQEGGSRRRSVSTESEGGGSSVQEQPAPPPRQRRGTTPASSTVRGSSNSTQDSSEGVKYWFEMQRMTSVGSLGNLILVPTTAAATRQIADADYDVKAAYYKSCGVESQLPEWSGSVVKGKYSQNCFSAEECKARHEALVTRLTEVFRLGEDDDDITPHNELLFDGEWSESDE